MNRFNGILLLLTIFFVGSSNAQQICNPKIASTAPDERYHDNGDGSVTDLKSGLEWARCSVGQQWEDNTCTGEAQPLLWSIANLVAATTEPPPNKNRWRLPEIKELSELAELQCARPAINLRIFPNTPSAAYWTYTRFANKDGSFWQVQFILGETVPEMGDRTAYVRLVRDPK